MMDGGGPTPAAVAPISVLHARSALDLLATDSEFAIWRREGQGS